METKRILVVEDDEITRILVIKMLENAHYEVFSASSVPEALNLFSVQPVEVILTDIEMKPYRGVELLHKFDELKQKPTLIFMTSKGSLSTAVETLAEGAFEYVGKPLEPQVLFPILDRAFLERKKTQDLILQENHVPDFGLIGRSPKMVELYKNVARAALSDSNVFIWGESGTGKELVAKAIHENSIRKENRFVTVNCGALTETLLESELFGHIKGAFTGAIFNKRGLFEEANGGTLFLDEIGDISPGLQVKLLRVIQEGEFKPVGSVENRRVNVRIIAATHRNLFKMVQEEKFREDLFYRLKVLTLQLPALRERPEDIIPLASYFLKKKTPLGKKCFFSGKTVSLLMNHSWPGNIRELEHAVERAVAMRQGEVLYPEDFALGDSHFMEEAVICEPHQPLTPPMILRSQEDTLLSLEELEKQHIVKVIKRTHFNKTRAAQILGIDRATLYRKAERYQISLGEKEESETQPNQENPFPETAVH